jgi:hypothetical protein
LQQHDYQAFSVYGASSRPNIYYEITCLKVSTFYGQLFMRCSFMSEDGSDDDGDDDGSGLGGGTCSFM